MGMGENTVIVHVIICIPQLLRNWLDGSEKVFSSYRFAAKKMRKLGKKTKLPRFSQDFQNDSKVNGIASIGEQTRNTITGCLLT